MFRLFWSVAKTVDVESDEDDDDDDNDSNNDDNDDDENALMGDSNFDFKIAYKISIFMLSCSS